MSGVKRYQNPEVYEALAAEYVLGTLQGKALKRFERLKHERPYIQYAVDIWERRINELGQTVPESRPSDAVWQNIKAEISAQESAANGEEKKGLFSDFWHKLSFWQAASFALSLALAVALLPKQPAHMPMPSYVSVLQSSAKEPMMVTIGDRKKRMVSVRLMEVPQVGATQDLELWAIPKGGGAPVSVGVVRQDSMETQLKLTKPHWSRIQGAEKFAISFEPKGGSSTGQPSGPIMYQGQCLDFI